MVLDKGAQLVMNIATLRCLVAVAGALCFSACVHAPPPKVLKTSDTAWLAGRVVAPNGQGEALPHQAVAQLDQALAQSRISVQVVGAGQDLSLPAGREAVERALAALGPERSTAVFLDLSAQYFSALEGRYRWVVSGTLWLREQKSGRLDAFPVEAVAYLDLPHLGYRDALVAAAPAIERQVLAALELWHAGPWAQVDSARPRGLGISGDNPSRAGPGASPIPPGESIYYVMIDRFRAQPLLPPADSTSKSNIDWAGGNLAGVNAGLDHIQSLGFTAIWLSPFFKCRTAPFFGHGAYHGYWVEDLFSVEPRFGTEADLVALAQELKRRHLRLYLDMVLNHVAPDAPLTRARPDWFHHQGSISDWNDPRQVENGDVHGLPDLAQEKPEVFDYLVAASKKWIDLLHPNGFRLDAVKHMPLAFWARYNRTIADYAGPEFVLLGEFYEGSPWALAKVVREGGFNAIFDFPLHFAVIDVACGDQHPGKILATLLGDRAYPPGFAETGLVTFLDNHDLPRLSSACKADSKRLRLAVDLMMLARGTPSIMYGTENAMTGNGEPENRGVMSWNSNAGSDQAQAISESLKQGLHRRQAQLESGLGAVDLKGDPAQVFAALHLPNSPVERMAFGAAAVAPLGLEPASSDRVVLVGSGPELGEWNPERGLAMQPVPLGFGNNVVETLPTWSVALPRGFLEFKLAVRRNAVWEWDQGGNRYAWVE